MIEMELEDFDDVDLTEEEKAMVAANDKAGLITEVACHFCGMQFDVKKTRSLRAHIEEVHVVGDMGYMCGVCCEEFESRKAVEAHMSSLHRAPKPFGCGVCGETFRLRNLLVKHFDGHSKQEMDNRKSGLCYCGECFEFSDSIVSLQTHVANHRELPIFVCAACGLQTQHRHIMVKHLETHVISNLLTASENKTNNDESDITNGYFPAHVQIDASKIDTNSCSSISHAVDSNSNSSKFPIMNDSTAVDSETQHDNGNGDMDVASLDIVNSLSAMAEAVEEGSADSASIAADAAAVLPEENANYKCGLCDAFFTNLADALTHAGSHQDEEGTMQQVEINVLMEEKCVDDAALVAAAAAGLGVDEVKTELLTADSSNSMDML